MGRGSGVAALTNSKNTGYMRLSEAMRRTGGAARATGGAVRSGARAGATATRRTGGLVHRVTGASVTPRLLPAEITLVTANARSQLITLTASMLGGAVAAGIQATAGSAWVLRAGTLIYLAAMVLALRLPDQVDVPPAPAAPVPPSPPPGEYPNENGHYASGRGGGAWAGQPGRDGRTLPYEPAALPRGAQPSGAQAGGDRQAAGSRHGRTTGGRRCRTLSNVGPIVGETLRGNAVLRAFSGYMVFFLAFYLRSAHFS